MADATKELQIIISAKNEANKTLKGFNSQLKSLTKNAAIASVGIIGIGVAVTKLVTDAGVLQSVTDAYNSVTEASGIAGDQLIEDAQKMASGTISELSIMRNFLLANTAIGKEALGESGKNFVKFTEIAKKSARATGQSVDFMFESIVRGLARTSPRILDNTGLIVNATKAYTVYAEEIGKSTKELTESEKKIALTNALIAEADDKYGAVAVTAGGVSSSIARMNIAMSELSLEIGTAMIPAFQEILETITPFIVDTGPKLVEAIKFIIDAFVALPGPIKVLLGVLAILLPVITVIGGAIFIFTAALAALASPIILVGALITGILIVAIAAAIRWIDDFKRSIQLWKVILTVAFRVVSNKVSELTQIWIGRFNAMKEAAMSVVNAIRRVIDAAKQAASRVKSALGFQHGGVVPGGAGDAVPAILHGGERVIPRTGTDVNAPAGGGGGIVVNLTIEGDVSSMNTIEAITEAVTGVLGRNNELIVRGVPI